MGKHPEYEFTCDVCGHLTPRDFCLENPQDQKRCHRCACVKLQEVVLEQAGKLEDVNRNWALPCEVMHEIDTVALTLRDAAQEDDVEEARGSTQPATFIGRTDVQVLRPHGRRQEGQLQGVVQPHRPPVRRCDLVVLEVTDGRRCDLVLEVTDGDLSVSKKVVLTQGQDPVVFLHAIHELTTRFKYRPAGGFTRHPSGLEGLEVETPEEALRRVRPPKQSAHRADPAPGTGTGRPPDDFG